MAVLEVWRLLPLFPNTFSGGRYAAQSLLSQYFTFTWHFLCISAPSQQWGRSSITEGVTNPFQVRLSLTHCLCNCELPAEECRPGSLCFSQLLFPVSFRLMVPHVAQYWGAFMSHNKLPTSLAKRSHFLL